MASNSGESLKLNTDAILDKLSKSHPPDKYAFFEELRIGGGFGKDSEQRFDAYAISYYPSKRNVTRCYEIKVSRSDFLSELKKPIKRKAGLRLANEFYFVTPKDLVKPEEVPPECGLLEVDEDGGIKEIIKAPFRDIFPPTWLFVSSILRREDKIRKNLYNALAKEDDNLLEYRHATLKVLDYHIDKWKNYRDGNKEVPDMFARELENIYEEVIAAVEANRRIR